MADGYGTWRMEHSAISHQPSAICHLPSTISHDGLPDTYGGEIADRRGEEALLVLVVRARAPGAQGAPRAVELALSSRFGSATASGRYPSACTENGQMPGAMPRMLHSPYALVRVENVRCPANVPPTDPKNASARTSARSIRPP